MSSNLTDLTFDDKLEIIGKRCAASPELTYTHNQRRGKPAYIYRNTEGFRNRYLETECGRVRERQVSHYSVTNLEGKNMYYMRIYIYGVGVRQVYWDGYAYRLLIRSEYLA